MKGNTEMSGLQAGTTTPHAMGYAPPLAGDARIQVVRPPQNAAKDDELRALAYLERLEALRKRLANMLA